MASEVSDDLSEVGAENEGVPVSSSSSVSNDLISELPSFMSETEDSNSYLELSSSETDSYLGYKHKDDASSKSSSSDLTQMSSSKDAEDNGSGSGSKVKFPVRPGIIWRKGERVEAEDYQKHWYSSKIMNINEETKSVLIHFEGWNQRYDEWVDMNSERLRPLTRHSERREKRRRGKTVYRVGDQVLAKWTDCKMYLAKVDEVMNDGSYMVLFYDGFRRNIQPINLRPVPMEQKQQKFQIKPPVLSPKDLKNIKTKPVDFRGKQVAISNASGTGVITCQTGERLAKPLSHASGGQKKPKLIISGSLFSKKGKVLPKSRPKGVLHNKLKNVAKVNEKREIKIKKEQAVFSEEAAEVSSQTRTASIGPKNPVCQKRPRSGSFPEEKNKRMKVIGQLKTSDDPGMIKKAKSVDIDKTVESPVSLLPPILPLPTAPPKAFFVEEDHNLFKCDTCCKGFRKNQLLQDHIKHYHKTEILQLTSTVTKKRTKTLSTCSTDSDISASSKSNSAKRRRNISEMSVGSPEVALKMSFEEESPSAIVMASSEINVMEASVAEIEEDTSDEVVNCICGCREETGTMIQCDCCQCWQHTSCFGFTDQDLTSDTFLNTYVCFVCKQPRGLRENARYLYDMDWFRRGRLPIFSFVKAEGIENSEIPILGTHALISELLVVQKVMHGLREEIALTGERDHQELQLWQPQPTKDLHSISIGVTADKQEDNLQSANLSALVNNDFLTTKTEPGTVNILESTVCAGNSISSETEREARTFGNTKTLSLKRPKTKYTECISKAQTCSFSLASSKVVESGFKSFKEKSKEIKDISKSAEDVHFMDSYMKNCKNGDKTHDTEECSNKTNGRFSTGHFGISEEQKCEKAKSTTHCDPFAACKLSMLNCIQSVHEDLSHQLDNLELQILALEHQEYGADGGSCYSTIPPLKNSLHRLVRDLNKVKNIASYR